MEQLVEEKVDAFWKGLENVALKQGEVRWRLLFVRVDSCSSRFLSRCQKKIKERLGLGLLRMRCVSLV